MKGNLLHTFTKKAIVCLIFFFSFLFSFSASFKNHHVYNKIEDETSIETDNLNYSEFILSAHGHLAESPENPAEGDTNVEVEKEKETDDDKDELLRNHSLQEIISVLPFPKENYFQSVFLFSDGTVVPFYILFHSWKSFLI